MGTIESDRTCLRFEPDKIHYHVFLLQRRQDRRQPPVNKLTLTAVSDEIKRRTRWGPDLRCAAAMSCGRGGDEGTTTPPR